MGMGTGIGIGYGIGSIRVGGGTRGARTLGGGGGGGAIICGLTVRGGGTRPFIIRCLAAAIGF